MSAHLHLVPAYKLHVKLTTVLPIGQLSSGSQLIFHQATASTITTIGNYQPCITSSDLVFGANWGTMDPSGKFGRPDIRGVFKTEDGEIIYMTMNNGIITNTPEVMNFLRQTPDAATTTFKDIIVVPKFQTGEKYKDLENSVWVASGRGVMEGGMAVEYIISKVVAEE